MIVYKTEEWKGFGKQNYYWYEYRLDGDMIVKYKCNRHKFFDGKENEWNTEDHYEESWSINDSNIPEWLKKYI